MYSVELSRRAATDLDEIWFYSAQEWGITQADRYVDTLNECIQQLALAPKIGKSRDSLRPGYRSIQVARHVIFYTLEGSTVSIRRVLHERMDPPGYL